MKKMVMVVLLGLCALVAIYNGVESMFIDNWNMVGSFVVAAVLFFVIRRITKNAGGWKHMVDSIPDKELGGENPCYKK